jgi:hypothetical protein
MHVSGREVILKLRPLDDGRQFRQPDVVSLAVHIDVFEILSSLGLLGDNYSFTTT